MREHINTHNTNKTKTHNNRWWGEYADRKNDDADDHVADSLLYDRNHLPRSAPAPECVARAAAAAAAGKAAGPGTPAPEGG